MTLTNEEFAGILQNNPELLKRNPGLAKTLGVQKEEPVKEASQSGPKKAKYLNHKVFVYEDGYVSFAPNDHGHGLVKEKYDSVKEFERYQELVLLQRAGKITDLRRQVKLVIQEAFTYRGEKVHEIAYVADHIYYNSKGEQIVEDVKGVGKDGNSVTATKDFKLKWKLLKAKYPQYLFEIY